MASEYEIGTAPKLRQRHGAMMSSERALLTVWVTPLAHDNSGGKSIQPLLDDITGILNLKPDVGAKMMNQRAQYIRGATGGLSVKNYDRLKIYCQQSGAFTENFSNQVSQVSLFGKLNESLGGSSLSQYMQAFKRSGIDPMGVIQKAVGAMGDAALSPETAKTVHRYLDWAQKSANLSVHALSDRQNMDRFFRENNMPDNSVTRGFTTLVSQVSAILSGDLPIIPNLWSGSSYTCSYNFTITLYNPVPASDSMHRKCIMEPLSYLQALALPSTDTVNNENGESIGNDRTYTSPLYVGIESPGLFKCKAGIVDGLNIIKGGDENAIAFNGRPIYVTVNMSVQPLYNIKMISHINNGYDTDASVEYNAMCGTNSSSIDPLTSGMDNSQISDTATSIDEGGAPRVSEADKEKFKNAGGDNMEFQLKNGDENDKWNKPEYNRWQTK